MVLRNLATNSPSPSPLAEKGLTEKWTRRPWLLVIGGICLALWFLSPWLKGAWIKPALEYFPLVSGLVLVGEQLIKLI